MSYVHRDGAGTYYFRKAVPESLRPFMPAPWTGKREWKRSLATKDHPKAKRAMPRLLALCGADFEAAERGRRGEPGASSA